MTDGVEKLNAWLEDFEYDNETQRKAVLAYLFWLNDKRKDGGILPATPILGGLLLAVRPHDLFIAEKLREGQEWMIELMADHVERLERQIAELRQELRQGNQGTPK